MNRLLRLRNRHFLLLDIILLLLSPWFALFLRDPAWQSYIPVLVVAIQLFLAIKLVVFILFELYSRYWRYASIDELLMISFAVGTTTFITTGLNFFVYLVFPDYALPRSVPFIDGLLTLLIVGGSRFGIRVWEYRRRRGAGKTHDKRIIIAGAGEAGQAVLRETIRSKTVGFNPVAFVDDDPNKQGLSIQGVNVIGSLQDIPKLVKQLQVKEVIIAMPTAPGKVIRDVVRACEQANVASKIVPGLSDLLSGQVSVSQLRNVEIEDLLRRAPIQTDVAAVQSLIRGQRVLVTGGGGSIGSELCRQLFRSKPAELIILGHGENSVFTIHQELSRWIPPETKLSTVIADIRFEARVQAIFEKYCPQIVFHAAAHKHVPLMEMNPEEAITNNVLGTQNLLRAALFVDVAHFVMISTDKAVNPTSIMGASKRVAELLVHQAAKRSGKPYVAVRFGNVLGSRGSVVLTFKRQIANGGPITVTHPDMTRFFMTIPEAVQLVLQAATLGTGGEVFVLDMGEPVRIVDLARDLIELSGLEVGRDIDIAFTGTRPGEKLFEELFVDGENYERTKHDKIFIAGNASGLVPASLDKDIQTLAEVARSGNHQKIIRCFEMIIPEYTAFEDSPTTANYDNKSRNDQKVSPIPSIQPA